MVRFSNHLVAFLQFRLREIDGMTLIAGLHHLIPFFLPVFLCQSSKICSLHHIKPCRWFPVRIKHTKGLENCGTICSPLLILRHRQPHSEKAPCSPDSMVTVLHMTRLTCRRGNGFGEYFILFQQISNTVLGSRIHFPLRMINTHVAGSAGLWLFGFLKGEDMPGMAGIA